MTPAEKAREGLSPSKRVVLSLSQFPVYEGDYVLVGSGPMALRDMRPVDDLDIFTTTEDWFRLVNEEGFKVITTRGHDTKRRCDPPIASKVLEGIEVNVFFDWRLRDGDMLIDVTKEMDAAEEHCYTVPLSSPGRAIFIRSMRLERLIAWKLSAGRDKDIRDIAQIARYLTGDDDE